MFSAFLLGMLGSLAANLVTSQTQTMITAVEGVKDVKTSNLLGDNKIALFITFVVLTGSIIYLVKRK